MDLKLTSSIYRKHWRPISAAAVRAYADDLRLVFNVKYSVFQVLRVQRKIRVFDSPTVGKFAYSDTTGVWELDWMEGLDTGDDPGPLIAEMIEADLRRDPELERKKAERLFEHKRRVAETVKDNWRHAFKDNRRQLLKAWEPLVNSPGFVR